MSLMPASPNNSDDDVSMSSRPVLPGDDGNNLSHIPQPIAQAIGSLNHLID
ncbi:hypothetical protein SCLCIDRAFT_23714 [Scleroderma citrinum Foug A]|uniref:Uncharacterized protein n=1 Tax=Scleroderma citrinum Foug A TaxID=1036808 RepID=A0A0C2ZRD0_9AGAM|nr:hypothetical protein SCLCIDRAFT_23714 [Scleroderma citrinum Foug A]